MGVLIRVITLALLLPSMLHGPLHAGERAQFKAIRAALKKGEIKKDDTCLDEYFQRYKSLKWKTRLIPVAGLVGVAAAVPAGITFTFMAGFFFMPTAATVIGVMGGISALSSWGGTAYFEEVSAIQRLRATRPILFALWEMQREPAEYLAQMHKRYLDFSSENISFDEFQNKLSQKDKSGIFCDGTLTGQSSNRPLRKLLADESQIFLSL